MFAYDGGVTEILYQPTLSWSKLEIFVWDNIVYEINKWVGSHNVEQYANDTL
jgi:hypothetical protein